MLRTLRERVVGTIVFLVAVLALAPAAGAQFKPGGPIGAPEPPDGIEASAVPGGFAETIAMSGLTFPTQIRFAADGRVFVAEKSGLIKQFDSVSDPTATIYADLRASVHDFWDRGLLGLALDPQFTTGRPFVYALYTYDARIGQSPPTWGDGCPTPPGATADGCVVSGRLSKLNGGVEQVLINDWCQQYPSHTIGSIAFGADGALYASSGDGASFNFADYGQDGNPVNPCGDPPGGAGGSMTPPTAEGGALRSQDVRTSADPTTLDGTILRLNPDTGAAMAGNPNIASPDLNTRRIVASGLRNPFRLTIRPGTNDVYVGDVGWNDWEEINRLPSSAAPVENFGWPCYEGAGRQTSYDNLNLNVCENLYAAGAGAVTAPLYGYHHSAKVSTESCPVGGSSIAGLDFYDGGTFPAAYNGALFWADYSRDCIWVMFAGAGGVPDPATRQPFVQAAENPVDVQVGPGGHLYYADFNGGTIRRVQALSGNEAPTARATATPASGALPLSVSFSASGSTDPNGGPLTYEWDLDGDGAFDDSTALAPSFTYTTAGVYTVRLRVTDAGGLTGTDAVTVTAGVAPTPAIATPAAGTTWAVGDTISFSGSAVNAQGDPVPASGLTWRLVLQHCSALNPASCHEHIVQSFSGATGSFTTPDHDYPAYLELVLTATDGGLSASTTRRLDPRTVDLTFETQPGGLQLSVGSEQQAATFTRTAIQGATVSLVAPTPQTLAGTSYDFASWSDGGARAHTLTAPAVPATYRATYATATCPPPTGLVGAWGFDETAGTSALDASGSANNGTIAGATRTPAGRYGSALTFDGIDDLVTVPDSATLDLTNRATLQAWVYPTATGDWRTALLKERPGGLVYSLYSHNNALGPSTYLHIAGDRSVDATTPLPLNTWTHLSMTWDGATMRLYVNATQVATTPQTGTLTASTGALRFGGNTIWGEWFTGRLDDIRIHNRALTPTELQTDMNTAVTPAP